MCPCFHPVKAYYPLETDNQGKRYLKFGMNRYKLGLLSNISNKELKELYNNGEDFDYDSDFSYPIYYNSTGDSKGLNIIVPCGKCLGCKLNYSRQWALRSSNEAYMHNYYNNCAFVTFTFNDEMLNRRFNPRSLNKAAFTSWIKRLRKAVKAHYDVEFRLMACGEYGHKHSRPHYHLIIYGFNFPDKYPFQVRKVKGQEVIYYRSPFLEKIWSPAHSNESYGFSVIGDVTFESSAYVARYCTKKLFGSVATKFYKDCEPEFLTTRGIHKLSINDFIIIFFEEIKTKTRHTTSG